MATTRDEAIEPLTILDNPHNGLQLTQPIVWLDLEMTGLDLKNDRIIEAALFITNHELTYAIKGPHVVINAPDELLDGMDPWCWRVHGQSGLTQLVRDSKLSVQEADTLMLDFVTKFVPKPQTSPLAGNSVHTDRSFMLLHMPKLISYLSRRIIDVSSVKELAMRWYPRLLPFPKGGTHRACEDILESIEELRYFRQHIFRDTARSTGLPV